MSVRILQGDVRVMLATLETDSVQVVCTSPPYFRLRSYLDADHPDKAKEIGSEQTPAEFVSALVDVFDAVRRVLRKDGVLFVNLGDSYAGSGKGPTGHNGIGDQEQRQGFTGVSGKSTLNIGPDNMSRKSIMGGGVGVAGIPAKNLLLIPERFAIAMQDAGWIVRSRIAWCKTSAMPESVRDRPTSAWEHIWMFTRSARYFWDADAVRPGRINPGADWNDRKALGFTGRTTDAIQSGMSIPSLASNPNGANLRNYWLLGPAPSSLEHYASFPPEIPKRCILAASRPGDTVLDPFLGSGTTELVADQLGRNAVGVELNPKYAEMARRRIANDCPMFSDIEVSA